MQTRIFTMMISFIKEKATQIYWPYVGKVNSP